MLLTIKSKAPAWWIDERSEGISKWWDGLEWQDYEPMAYHLEECSDPSMINEAMCATDFMQQTIMDSFEMGWMYKMIGNAGTQVRAGIESEILDAVIWMF